MKYLAFKDVKSLLNSPKKIVIIPHYNPDGDAIGSALGLYHYFIQKKHKTSIIVPNDYPKFLKWLTGTSVIINFESDVEKAKQILFSADLIFTVDFNALHRIGNMKSILESNTAPKIMIDHHQQPEDYAAYMYSDVEMGSTSEMIYHFINRIGDSDMLNKSIAEALYTGIVTDTASFRFPKTTPTTHNVVAKLINCGINHSEIHNKIYDSNRFDRIKLLGIALNNLKIIIQHNAAYITLSQSELDSCNYQKGDTEGLVNYGLSIKGIKLAAIFIENKSEGIVKISFRSKGNFDVNKFSRHHFNGGGHKNAAGGKSDLSLEKIVSKFEFLLNDNGTSLSK